MIRTTPNGYQYDTKDVLTIKDLCDTELEVGCEGYFADSFEYLETKIDKKQTAHMARYSASAYVMGAFCVQEGTLNYGMFLPADKVRYIKKEYRPFKSFEEFRKKVYFSHCPGVGESVVFKKIGGTYIHTAILTDVLVDEHGGLSRVTLGRLTFAPDDLFREYEWRDAQGVWHTFDVEEGK